MFLKISLLLMTLLPSVMVFAQEVEQQAESTVNAASQFSPGLLYYRDPETGELGVPPAHVARAMQLDATNFSDAGLELVELPDGSKMIDLQGRFQMSSVIEPGADGLVQHCTSHPHTLAAAEHSRLHQTSNER